MMYLWIYVTNDKFELPIFVCDTARELAEKKGVSVGTVKSAVYQWEHQGVGFYRKVKIDEVCD